MSAAPIEHRTLTLDGVDLHVLLAGEGRPLMLLHGWPDSAELWRSMIPTLVAAGYRVIAPDQRGFGLSSAPADVSAYRIERLAADAIAVLDALAVDRADLIGHDWGALVGWRICADHPDRVRRYAALSVGHPAAYARGGILQRLKAWYIYLYQCRGVAEALMSAGDFAVLRAVTREAEARRHWIADMSRPGRLTAGMNLYRANVDILRGSEPRRVAVPVLGVYGGGDLALTERQMTESKRYMDAPFRYRRIERAGHWLPLHAPDAVCALATDWFDAGGV